MTAQRLRRHSLNFVICSTKVMCLHLSEKVRSRFDKIMVKK